VDTIFFHDRDSLYVNQFVAAKVHWPEKGARIRQLTSFPEEERTEIHVNVEQPIAFALKCAPRIGPGTLRQGEWRAGKGGTGKRWIFADPALEYWRSR